MDNLESSVHMKSSYFAHIELIMTTDIISSLISSTLHSLLFFTAPMSDTITVND